MVENIMDEESSFYGVTDVNVQEVHKSFALWRLRTNCKAQIRPFIGPYNQDRSNDQELRELLMSMISFMK